MKSQKPVSNEAGQLQCVAGSVACWTPPGSVAATSVAIGRKSMRAAAKRAFWSARVRKAHP